jgi:hypothetical protein
MIEQPAVAGGGMSSIATAAVCGTIAAEPHRRSLLRSQSLRQLPAEFLSGIPETCRATVRQVNEQGEALTELEYER